MLVTVEVCDERERETENTTVFYRMIRILLHHIYLFALHTIELGLFVMHGFQESHLIFIIAT